MSSADFPLNISPERMEIKKKMQMCNSREIFQSVSTGSIVLDLNTSFFHCCT